MSNIQNLDLENYKEIKKKLEELKQKLLDWFIIKAIPTWRKYGIDYLNGGFFEALNNKLQPVDNPRRTRVICRQIYVFIFASKLGIDKDIDILIFDNYKYLLSRLRCKNGFFAYSFDKLKNKNDEKVFLYEQAFVVFVLASLFKFDQTKYFETLQIAKNLISIIRDRWFVNLNSKGKYLSDQFKTDPYMHLLEGLLLWEEALENKTFSIEVQEFKILSDQVVNLILKCVDKKNGFISEEYAPGWTKLQDESLIIEPGHQYEWSWLLLKWSKLRICDERISVTILNLLNFAEKYGIDNKSLLVVDSVSAKFNILKSDSKIWPQCERLKAWLVYYSNMKKVSLIELKKCYVALENLIGYLDEPFLGGWIECKFDKNKFANKIVKSSSFYHIVDALEELLRINLN